MPKMPEVTVHVTTEPDPKELSEFKASAAVWEEQCRTLQRTLIDAQVEQDKLRDCASKFGTELILAKARVAELEAAGTELLDAYRADVDAGLKHIFNIPPGPDPAFAAERLARAVDAFAVLFNR